jgi:hypothetical protein
LITKLLKQDHREIEPSSIAINSEKTPVVFEQQLDEAGEIAKPVRPTELRMGVAIPVVSLFAILITGLAILFVKARIHGKWT